MGQPPHDRCVNVCVPTRSRGDTTTYSNDPAYVLAYRIRAALDPNHVPSAGRTLASMSPTEIAALEQQYQCPVAPGPSRALQQRRRLQRLKRRHRRLIRKPAP
jgi:hypothetical protein